MDNNDQFKVELDSFSGPLDLLLYLVRRAEVDIAHIPISRIATEYLNYIDLMAKMNFEVAGDFLVMAATLMEIKSRMLLPSPPPEEEEEWEDPCEELVKQLIEYRRFKEAAVELSERQDEMARRFPRPHIPLPEEEEEEEKAGGELIDVSLWELLEAFGRLLKATGGGDGSINIVYDDTPQEVVMQRITDRLEEVRKRSGEAMADLEEIAGGQLDRGVLVSMILALLELVKRGRVRAVQKEQFGKIYLMSCDNQAESSGDGRA